ncbi:14443_t:CDS:2, partial [Acaulospora morrowiae]
RKRWYEIRNLGAPEYDKNFSYAENDWERIKLWIERATGQFLYAFESIRNLLLGSCDERQWFGDYLVPLIQGVLTLDNKLYVLWGEISVQASLRRRNKNKDILVEQLERSHQVDLLCKYEQYEIACVLACGGPHSNGLTKLASDKFHLTRIMKDMLDDLRLNLHKARKDGSRLYIIGIQGLLNSLVQELETAINDDEDGFKTPPRILLSNSMETNETPQKKPKRKRKYD